MGVAGILILFCASKFGAIDLIIASYSGVRFYKFWAVRMDQRSVTARAKPVKCFFHLRMSKVADIRLHKVAGNFWRDS